MMLALMIIIAVATMKLLPNDATEFYFLRLCLFMCCATQIPIQWQTLTNVIITMWLVNMQEMLFKELCTMFAAGLIDFNTHLLLLMSCMRMNLQ